jgi:DNA-binding GntR family transcriptional regulator
MPDLLMEQAYAKLRAKLEKGDLPPGTQLVNRALSKEFGVHTVTVREAIHRLASEGLVEHIPNAGAFVRKLNRREITELYKIRNVLDMFVIDEAFANIDEEQLDRLEDMCHDWHKLARSIRDREHHVLEGELNQVWIDNDVEFHRILVDSADNSLLKRVIAGFRLMAQIARTWPTVTTLSHAAKTYRMHACIVRALRKRDLTQARYWMSYHNAVGMADARRLAEES